ncbi:MAG: hypothetical protein HUJ93_00785, partial [Bacteroidales bacterium]|nr:hypothetical protein [Bacteroidales bacterium]
MGKIIFFSSDLHDDVSVIRSREYLQAELQKYENSTAPGSVCFIKSI